jgi:hypothetical protein
MEDYRNVCSHLDIVPDLYEKNKIILSFINPYVGPIFVTKDAHASEYNPYSHAKQMLKGLVSN